MDVDYTHFRAQLLPILTHISNSKFVTFDFEMSGITTKPKYGAGDRSHDVGKPSLQQQYEEMKSVAETFQVLQVGICCVEEDSEREYYLARPFNFNLSPLQAHGVDFRMDRRFEFSTSACEFLKKNGFDFGNVFSSGVTYLSQQEEKEIRKKEAERVDRDSKIPDIVLTPGSPELDFYRKARSIISTWVNDPKPERLFVNIGGDNDKDLNGFQRRLIYQLVRSEFPGYRTFARSEGGFMQIVKTVPEDERKRDKSNLDKMNTKIAKQTGMRWIFEALSNGNLNDIPIEWFSDDSGEKPELKTNAIKLFFGALKKKLKEKDHILVGHNLFTDLIFLYNTFFNQLPDKVTDFQEAIHRLFPNILDTKYIHTEGDNSMSGRNNLKEILSPFLKIHVPLILLDEQHTSYGASFGREHEAGYDSWMTAELLVKMTSKLYAERKHLIEDRDSDCESEANGAEEASSGEDEEEESGGALLDLSNQNKDSFQTLAGNSNLPPQWHAMQMQGLGNNRYASLVDYTEDPPDAAEKPKPKQWIPRWDGSFWDLYFNKLRVNAADTGVCNLEGGD